MRFCKECAITTAQPSSGDKLKAQDISRVKAGRSEEVHSTKKEVGRYKSKGRTRQGNCTGRRREGEELANKENRNSKPNR